MRNILKNRLALSTVVTTLIILVVSVLLAGVVTYFAINVTSTRVTRRKLADVACARLGKSGDTASQAAFIIMNTGGRDVDISKIQVRGQTADWTIRSTLLPPELHRQLTWHIQTTPWHTSLPQVAQAQPSIAATGDITLPSGNSIVVYVSNPDSVNINDIGLTVGITVFSSQAMYYDEVQRTSVNEIITDQIPHTLFSFLLTQKTLNN